MRCCVRALGCAALVLMAGVDRARAHESEASYLRLSVAASEVTGEWDVHLRDARLRIGLEAGDDGPAARAELREREAALVRELSSRLWLTGDRGRCEVSLVPDWTGGLYADSGFLRVSVRGRCPEPLDRLRIDYGWIFDLDPRHRGFLSLEDATQVHVGVFRAAEPRIEIAIDHPDSWREVRTYALAGAEHVASGLDHLLFLLVLLLAVLSRPTSPRSATAEVVKLVTAFTIAHSLTLSLAALGIVRLPPRWVESGIALSVLLAAWNNLRPLLPLRAWLLSGPFGLVHGLGFAAALSGLGLPRGDRVLALASFNAGVELGQLACVALALPALLWLRRRPRFPTLATVGSFGIAWLAALWLVERLLSIEIAWWV